MNRSKAGATALGIATLVAGCTAMPKVEPVEKAAEQAVVVGEPFVYQSQGEPVDVETNAIQSSLTLEQAVRLALQHDAQIQSALARVRQAEGEARQSRLLPNPVFAIAFRLPGGGGKSVIDADLSTELLSLITRPGRISAADSRLRRASAEALTMVLDVVLAVQRQYADAQAADARVEIVEMRRSIVANLVEVTNARLRAGEATRLDILTAQSELSAVESEWIALKSEQRLTRITLSRLIAQPSSSADWMLPAWSLAPEPKLSERDWIQVALNHRPELDAAKWELAALGHEVRIARAETLIAGSGGIAAERDDVWSIGPAASVPVPIFDTGTVAKQRRMDQVTEQQHTLTQTGRQIVEEVRKALETLQSARVGLDRVQAELLPLQEQRLQQARDSFRAGLTDIISLKLAEQDLQGTRARVIDLQQQVAKARFELDRAVGGSGTYLNRSPMNASTTRSATNVTE